MRTATNNKIALVVAIILFLFSAFMTIILASASAKEQSAYFAVGFVCFMVITVIMWVLASKAYSAVKNKKLNTNT